MELETFCASLSPEEKELQIGRAAADPLTGAFSRKRVVHAGLPGRAMPPEEAQGIWRKVMDRSPETGAKQCAYIHIPFCRTKCLYCSFFQNAANQEREDAYLDCLIREIESAACQPRLERGLIHAVFIGGGTPTSLSAANAARLLRTVKNCLPLANDYEMTLEERIHDLTPEKIEAWLDNGVNRVSVGVQSFDTQIRRQVGRLDDQETVLRRLATLQSYRQCAVIVDLMYGLPGQDLRVWEEDLRLLAASAADGMDLYQLNVFDGSDLHRRIQEGRLPPAATTAQQAEMYAFAHDFVRRRAFRRLSACHWSRDARERSLYNDMAKRGCVMFPFGCGAGGAVDGYMAMLHRSLPIYERMAGAGRKPLMVFFQESPLQFPANLAQSQLERGFFDPESLLAMDERFAGLTQLYDLWETRGLVQYNGVAYELTVAGQFWQINLAQTTIEYMQTLATGVNTVALQEIAAQERAAAAQTERGGHSAAGNLHEAFMGGA